MAKMEKKLGLPCVYASEMPLVPPAFTFLLKEALKPCNFVSFTRSMYAKVCCCLVYDTWKIIEINNWPRLTKTANLYLVKSKSVLLVGKRIGVGSAWGVSPAQSGFYAGIPVPAAPE